MNTWLDWLLIPSIAVFVVIYHIREQKKYLDSVKVIVSNWAAKNKIVLNFDKVDFCFSDNYRSWVVVYGTDSFGVERKYTLKATGFWAYSLLDEPRIIASEIAEPKPSISRARVL